MDTFIKHFTPAVVYGLILKAVFMEWSWGFIGLCALGFFAGHMAMDKYFNK
jgi:hypothetical protein